MTLRRSGSAGIPACLALFTSGSAGIPACLVYFWERRLPRLPLLPLNSTAYASLGRGVSDNNIFSASAVSTRLFCCNSLTQLVTV